MHRGAPINVAQVLLGACPNYVLVDYVPDDEARSAPPEDFVPGLIEVVMSGLAPGDTKEGS